MEEEGVVYTLGNNKYKPIQRQVNFFLQNDSSLRLREEMVEISVARPRVQAI